MRGEGGATALLEMHAPIPRHRRRVATILVLSTQVFARFRVSHPVDNGISKRFFGHSPQEVCPWNAKFSSPLADDAPFRARAFLDGKDAVTLATDILALNQESFSAAFRKSPMKRAKLAGLRRNAAVVLANNAGR